MIDLSTSLEIKNKAILIGITLKNQKNNDEILTIYDSMYELMELAQAANLDVVATVIQNKEAFDATFLIGKGKLDEIKITKDHLEADLVIFDNELSGSQIRNISKYLDAKVIDRTTLILEIFARRAISKEGKLQVELAQQKYRYSRLSGMGDELSRQAGGIGSKGPGEKKLETDKRHIRSKIDEIKKNLLEIDKQRDVKRKARIKSKLPIVALIGYTNSGKSTLFNEMIKTHFEYSMDKEVLAEDKLFASLDVQLRKATLPSKTDILVTDTVGFVSNIPHDLIEAFKATLEEVEYADVLLHVIDISNKNFDIQIKTTNKILEDLKLENKPIIYVYNKIDRVEEDIIYHEFSPNVKISALKNINLEKLYFEIDRLLNSNLIDVNLLLPYGKGDLINLLHNKYNFEEEYQENGVFLSLKIKNEDIYLINKFIIE